MSRAKTTTYRARRRSLRVAGFTRLLGALLIAAGVIGVIVVLGFGVKHSWIALGFVLLAIVGGIIARGSGRRRLAKAIEQSDLDVVKLPWPQAVPYPVASVWDLKPIAEDIPALKSLDGRVTVARGAEHEEGRVEGGRGTVHTVVAWAGGLPPGFRGTVSFKSLGRVNSTEEPAAEVVLKAFRDARVFAEATLDDGYLVCHYPSLQDGRRLVAFVKAVELAVSRLEAFDRAGPPTPPSPPEPPSPKAPDPRWT